MICLTSALAGVSVGAQTDCPGTGVTTQADGALGSRVCSIARRTKANLAACGLPPPGQVEVTLRDTLPKGCVGNFDCETETIEILNPVALDRVRVDSGAWAEVETPAYFDSILTHELTHAALRDLPCPFSGCRLNQEYVAYAMQIRSLPPEARAAFGRRSNITGKVSRDALNEMMLHLAPDRFAQKVWAHLGQRPDACAYLKQLAEGVILLDSERF